MRSQKAAIELIKRLLQAVSVAAVTGDDIYEALELQWNDFEDSVQYVVGKSILAECIVSRNNKDFAYGTVKALTPEEILNNMENDLRRFREQYGV